MGVMSLTEAREVIRQHNAGGNPGYATWASACAVVYENAMHQRGRQVMTTDSKPSPVYRPPLSAADRREVQRLLDKAMAIKIPLTARQQREQTRDAAPTRTFDQVVKLETKRDARWSRNTLAAINTHNRAKWAPRS